MGMGLMRNPFTVNLRGYEIYISGLGLNRTWWYDG